MKNETNTAPTAGSKTGAKAVLLYTDELRGFARSKVMYVLWIGLPVLTIIIRLARPDTEGIPLLSFVAIMIASIGGTLSAVLLSTTVTSERNRHVYDLFLIRPVERRDLIIAKYLAALTCLVIAAVLSMGLGAAVDAFSGNLQPGIVKNSLESVVISVASMAIACSVGLFFGIVVNSVAVSAILSVYLGNQLSAIIILPTVLVESLNRMGFSAAVGIAFPVVLLFVTIKIFERKSL